MVPEKKQSLLISLPLRQFEGSIKQSKNLRETDRGRKREEGLTKAGRMYCRRQSEHMDLDAGSPLVAVAIDKDKGSQNALKWAVDNLVTRGQTLTLILIHVKITSHPSEHIFLFPEYICNG